MSEVRGAHLVGSAPMESAVDHFEFMVARIGSHICRLADGEVGERDTWIRFQNDRLAQSPQLETTASAAPGGRPAPMPQWTVRAAAQGQPIELPELGYARAAIESFDDFQRLKASAVIPEHIRFQVGLPTPLGLVTAYVERSSRATVLAAYQTALLGELHRILQAIPHDELAVQWETVFEIYMLENDPRWQYFDDVDPRPHIARHVGTLSNAVPEPVQLGWHLCYGDAGHKHFIEPADARHLTWMANTIAETTQRTLDFVHMPVPRERDDDAYFAPLRELRLPELTELYLGLVHNTGGADGTRRRIATAAKVVPRFGVATECGFGRRPRDSIGTLLDQFREFAEPRA